MTPDRMQQITQVTDLSETDLKNRTLDALQTRDPEWLWAVVEAHMHLYGKAGVKASAHTFKSYRHGLKLLLSAPFPLDEPPRDAGAIFVRTLEASGLSPSTVNVRLAAARACYKAWVWTRGVQRNPFEDVHAVAAKEDRTLKRTPYTEDELDRLLQLATPRLRVLLLLCAHGGLRIAEALDLTWQDVDLKRELITVRSGKGGKSRQTFISERLERALLSLPERSGKLFEWDDQAARYQIRKVAQAAEVDIKGRVFHGFRHQAGTRLYLEKRDLNEVAAYLGHSNINTTRIYAKVDQDGTRKSIRKW